MVSDFQKAKDITQKTKLAVLDRQNYKSVISNNPLTLETASFHHFIERGQSGIGYEWNVVALTFEEHRYLMHDKVVFNGIKPKQAEEIIVKHFKDNYDNWTRDNCKYRKWYAEKDYGVNRKEIHT